MSALILFESKKIRRSWNEQENKWYFSVQDVIEILTESTDIKQYIKRLKSRDLELKANWGTICTPVEMIAADGEKHRAIKQQNK
jgi:DNA-damage-inducible protein D